jgi:heme exporter protein D
MNWGSLDTFLAMGGHGFYVWGSYVVTFALVAIEVVWVRRTRGEVVQQIKSGASVPQADIS